MSNLCSFKCVKCVQTTPWNALEHLAIYQQTELQNCKYLQQFISEEQGETWRDTRSGFVWAFADRISPPWPVNNCEIHQRISHRWNSKTRKWPLAFQPHCTRCRSTETKCLGAWVHLVTLHWIISVAVLISKNRPYARQASVPSFFCSLAWDQGLWPAGSIRNQSRLGRVC